MNERTVAGKRQLYNNKKCYKIYYVLKCYLPDTGQWCHDDTETSDFTAGWFLLGIAFPDLLVGSQILRAKKILQRRKSCEENG